MKSRYISTKLSTEIPCLECEHGHYDRDCVKEPGDPYIMLTCPICGDWEFYDRYLERRELVMQAVGSLLCEWRVCSVSGLTYMVRV